MADQTAVKEQKPPETRPQPQVKTRSVKYPDGQRVKQKLVQAEISTWVQWYEIADPRHTPWPALVTGKGGDDRNHLMVLRISGRAVQQLVRENVPHMSDPTLSTKKPMPGMPPRGAWDFNPDAVPERYKDLDAMQYRIVLLHQLHAYTAKQCAAAVGGGWTEELAQAVLDAHAKTS